MARRTKQEAQQTRHALLDAAELVFERRGVAGTSLQEVAAAAGLTRGAVYWHFRDKADLFNAMMDRAVLPFEQHWLEGAASDAADPLSRLRELLHDILRQLAVDERLRRVFTISTQKVEYVGELDAIRERHLRVYQQSLRRIELLLRQAAAAGFRLPPRRECFRDRKRVFLFQAADHGYTHLQRHSGLVGAGGKIPPGHGGRRPQLDLRDPGLRELIIVL